jgi:hypothetical protein
VDDDARAWIGESLEAPGSPLGLGHDRGAQSEPVKGRSNDAQRKDLREGRFRLDADETAELPAFRLDDGEVQVALGSRSRPASPQPVGVDHRRAQPRHALLVREGSDLLRVLVQRGPHPESGEQLHCASVPDPGPRKRSAEAALFVSSVLAG